MKNLKLLLVTLSAAALLSVAASAQPPAAAVDNRPPETPVQTNTPTDAPLNPKLPTLFIVSDSTARNGADLGWGDHLANYFDTTKINVANRARAGRSARSYMDEGLWDKDLAEMKAGDYVLIQWGHNDGGDLGGNKPRGDLRGDGDATQDVPQTTGPMAGKTETIHTFGWYDRKYVADAKAKGATPFFASMTIRNVWKPDASGVQRIERETNPEGYNGIMKKVADDNHLLFVDMATVEADRLEATGMEKTALLFPIDHTHSSAVGADLNAQSVVIAMEQANSPLVSFLKAKLPLPTPAAAATK
jgi:lysophospholipase L1-like esterase